ncbi:hypothetical protein Dsin_016940 [Dipteronia sinensis]|uniref:Reverse transcriptase zinc-binding domain-containing protein n=1 Tax=Dipteronia sinensis TaxID=43782 RepID=A0AAE0AEC4_9ROSI|nr:hypothetical protein Dsin_016940 [Dipteronia sinensis]
MKIDIHKAFDTLDWSFLRRVLQAFGFSSVFMDWIDSILGSSRLSVLISGSPKDDVLIFCRGKVLNLKNIMSAFEVYSNISDWSIAFLLLGGPVISGKTLSLTGRATLIKSVITGSFVHYFMIYKWHSSLLSLLRSRVFDFIHEGSCVLGYSFRARFPDLYFWIDRIAISPVAYSLVWAHSRDGQVSCKSAYSSMIHDSLQISWWSDVWCRFILPSPSALTWHLLLNLLPIEDRLCRAGFHVASRCSVCRVSSESSDHIFLRFPLAAALWETVFSAFQRCISTDSWSSFFSLAMSVSFSDKV